MRDIIDNGMSGYRIQNGINIYINVYECYIIMLSSVIIKHRCQFTGNQWIHIELCIISIPLRFPALNNMCAIANLKSIDYSVVKR